MAAHKAGPFKLDDVASGAFAAWDSFSFMSGSNLWSSIARMVDVMRAGAGRTLASAFGSARIRAYEGVVNVSCAVN